MATEPKRETECAPVTGPPSTGLRLGDAVALAAGALLIRVFSLGSFSLWVDEIFTSLYARGTLADVWRACQADANQPPLGPFVFWLLNGLGAAERGQRLAPVLAGVATIVVLAWWAGRAFSRRVGVTVGLLSALWPLHVHYSQELRPYSYLVLFVVVALLAVDRLTVTPRAATVVLGLAIVGGLWSHYFFAAALIPLGVLAFGTGRAEGRRRLVLLGGASLAGVLAFAPWLPTLAAVSRLAAIGGTKHWTLAELGLRWQFLTVGAREGEPLSWAAVLLAGLVLLGACRAPRTPAGRAVLAGSIAGILGPELLLLASQHWSNGRYDLIAWPFLVVLGALGLEGLLRLPPHGALGIAALGAVVVGELSGLSDYDYMGRPHWDAMAAAVASLHRPGEPIFAENEWTRISLAYHLDGRLFDRRPPDDRLVVSVDGDVRRLASLWAADRCALLVSAGVPHFDGLRTAATTFPLVFAEPATDDARVFLLTPALRNRLSAGGYPELGPAAPGCTDEIRTLPYELRRPRVGRVRGALDRLLGRRPTNQPTRRLDFDRVTSEAALAYGWSHFETAPDGTTFVWALGHLAVLDVPVDRGATVIALRVWPFLPPSGRQTMSIAINDGPPIPVALAPGAQVVERSLDAAAWRKGGNRITLRFALATPPSSTAGAGSGDSRPLAVAFDWLELR